jgi:hypothetical protein
MAIPGPGAWLAQIFDAQEVKNGGVVRRSVEDVKKYASHDELIKAVKAQEFHLIQTGNQYVVLCHKGDIRIFC